MARTQNVVLITGAAGWLGGLVRPRSVNLLLPSADVRYL